MKLRQKEWSSLKRLLNLLSNLGVDIHVENLKISTASTYVRIELIPDTKTNHEDINETEV